MPQGTIHLDTFTDSDGTLLSAHTADTPLGAYITGIVNGLGPATMEINSNRVAQESASIAGFGIDAAAVVENDIEIRMTLEIGATTGFDHQWYCRAAASAQFAYEIRIVAGAGDSIDFEMRKFVSFAPTSLDTFNLGSLSFPVTLELVFECFDSEKRFLIDSVERMASSDNEVTGSGGLGLDFSTANGSPITNMEINRLEILAEVPVVDRGVIHGVTQEMIDTVTRSVAA